MEQVKKNLNVASDNSFSQGIIKSIIRIKNLTLAIPLLFCASTYAQKSDSSSPRSVVLKLNDGHTMVSTKKAFTACNMSILVN